MARISQALNPGELQSLPDGEHCDGGGLYLRVTGIGGRSWVVKYQWAGKQEKMGIGRLANVSLKKAREDAEGILVQAPKGINPKLHRKQVSASAPAGLSARKHHQPCGPNSGRRVQNHSRERTILRTASFRNIPTYRSDLFVCGSSRTCDS
jgi:hypothetical protein